VGNESALMAELFVYGLPNDYFQKLPASFEAVTPEAVAKAAEDTIHPQNLVVVAVGDRAKIQSDLEKLDLGPIELRDESGELVKK
jgi:zinc protease